MWDLSSPTLQTLNLYSNQFSGSIPATIFSLSALQVINLRNNHLLGSKPAEIGNLKMLKAIYIDNNKFEEIPNEIGSLDQLEKLSVQSNALKGHVPVAIFNMSSLTILNLHGNNLNGRIPYNICQDLPNIQELYFGHNKLDGPLPSALWQCKQLLVLSLEANNFSGTKYKSIANLTRIKEISLGYNNFTYDDMVAHVADFGIAKLLGEGASMSTTLATIGCMAPEYGMGGIVSRRGDVYSFGIVLMETFTKRKPTDDMFVGQMNLKQWVANALLSDAIAVLDSNLIGTQDEDEDFVSKRQCFSYLMHLAMACCKESPEEWINIQDVLAALDKIKNKFMKDTAGGVLPNVLLFSRRSVEEFYSIFHGL